MKQPQLLPQEHYLEAERLLEEANHIGHTEPDTAARYVAAAHVHALLALYK